MQRPDPVAGGEAGARHARPWQPGHLDGRGTHQHPWRSLREACAGHPVAAQILAELGDDRTRFVSVEHLAAEAGVAPVTKASGKSHAVETP